MSDYTTEFYTELKRISYSLQNNQEENNIKANEIIEILKSIDQHEFSDPYKNHEMEKLLEKILKKNERIDEIITELRNSNSNLENIKYNVLIVGFGVCYCLYQILEVLKKLQ